MFVFRCVGLGVAVFFLCGAAFLLFFSLLFFGLRFGCRFSDLAFFGYFLVFVPGFGGFVFSFASAFLSFFVGRLRVVPSVV